MNPTNQILDEFRNDKERVLDRLVDGELSEADRHILLKALDDEPASWRRCALAFIESQSWKKDLCQHAADGGSATALTSTAGTQHRVSVAPSAAKKSWRLADVGFALAAGLLVAVGAGLWAGGIWSPLTGVVQPQQFAREPNTGGVRPTYVSASAPWRTFNLNVNNPETGTPSKIQLPVMESQHVSPDWLRQPRSAMPDRVKESLQRSGHHVTQQQHLWPIELKDGRRLVVPVEQVDVTPQERTTY